MKTSSNRFLNLGLLAVVIFLSPGPSLYSATKTDHLIQVGTLYSEAVEQLAAAGIKESGTLTVVDERDHNQRTEQHFFVISDNKVTLVVDCSKATDSIKGLSLNYFATRQSVDCVKVVARSIDFKNDKSYVVHFEPSSK